MTVLLGMWTLSVVRLVPRERGRASFLGIPEYSRESIIGTDPPPTTIDTTGHLPDRLEEDGVESTHPLPGRR